MSVAVGLLWLIETILDEAGPLSSVSVHTTCTDASKAAANCR